LTKIANQCRPTPRDYGLRSKKKDSWRYKFWYPPKLPKYGNFRQHFGFWCLKFVQNLSKI
jgi:hypothetical protein